MTWRGDHGSEGKDLPPWVRDVLHDSPAPPPPPPPAPPAAGEPDKPGNPLVGFVVIGLVLAMCCGVGVFAFRKFTRASENVEKAKTGDCVAQDDTRDPPLKLVRCRDSAAVYVVLKLLPPDAVKPCQDVGGASLLFETEKKVVCLGEKGVDPAKSMNIAKVGDCVTADRSRPERVGCAGVDARYQVLARFDDSTGSMSCDKVPGTDHRYALVWNQTGPRAVHRIFAADLVFCLGDAPAIAAASASASAAASTCRFIPDADVAAAVSRATGRSYTAGTHEEYLGCRYHFANSSEHVDTDWKPGRGYEPLSGDQRFTLDGLRAFYTEDTVTVAVEVAGGMFTVVMLNIAGAGDSLSRTIGIEVFRAARPHLG